MAYNLKDYLGSTPMAWNPAKEKKLREYLLASRRGISLDPSRAPASLPDGGDMVGADLQSGKMGFSDLPKIELPTVEGVAPHDVEALQVPAETMATSDEPSLQEQLAAQLAARGSDNNTQLINGLAAAAERAFGNNPSAYDQRNNATPAQDTLNTRQKMLADYLRRKDTKAADAAKLKREAERNNINDAYRNAQLTREEQRDADANMRQDKALALQMQLAAMRAKKPGAAKPKASGEEVDPKTIERLGKEIDPELEVLNSISQIEKLFAEDPSMSGVGIIPSVQGRFASRTLNPKQLAQQQALGSLNAVVRNKLTGANYSPGEAADIIRNFGLDSSNPEVVKAGLPLLKERMSQKLAQKKAAFAPNAVTAYESRGGALAPGAAPAEARQVIVMDTKTGKRKAFSPTEADRLSKNPRYQIEASK